MEAEHHLGAYMVLGNHASFIKMNSVLVLNCAPNFQISTF
jgi:hypothetical protein